MNDYATCLVGNANRLILANAEAYLLENLNCPTVMSIWGYDMQNATVTTDEILAVPTDIAVPTKRLLPQSVAAHHAAWVHPELLVLHQGRSCSINSLPKPEAAFIQLNTVTPPENCYEHGQLTYTETGWSRSPSRATPKVADHPFGFISMKENITMKCVQLVLPHGFYPALMNSLLLAPRPLQYAN